MQNEILKQLNAPFHPSRVTWKPQAITKDKAKAMAAAYADIRAYQDRLDEVCGLDWAVSYTPWGDKIICHITIGGITRSSTGESGSDAERSEIAGTAAEAQAFKRACAMFSLGRYLYNLPTLWVEYDAEHKRFTDKGLARLNGVIAQHYSRHLDGRPEESPPQADRVAAPIPDNPFTDPDPLSRSIVELDALGREIYGDKWPDVRAHNIKRLTGDASATLSGEQIRTLLCGLRKLRDKST